MATTKTKPSKDKFSLVQKIFLLKNSDLVKAPRNSNFILLTAVVGALNIIGIVMVLSASSVTSLGEHGTAWYFFRRQLLWLSLGVLAFALMSRIPYSMWRKFTKQVVFLNFVLLTIVLIPGIGMKVAGSRRWLGIGSISFQPSELAKFALVIFCADFLTRRVSKMDSFREGLLPLLLTTGAIMFLVFIEPDFDSTLVLALIAGMIILMAGVPMRFIGRIAAAGAVLAPLGVAFAGYRRERILTYLDPFSDASNSGYQIVQSLIALGSGKTSGVGLGAGKAKWLFLPNAHTDFIFSIIGEELGLAGTMMVVGLFIAFILIGIRIILSCADRFSALVATGIMVWIGGQAIINLMAVIGLVPVSGITLPFVSFGGSSLVITMGATGVLANIARYSRA